MAEDKKTCRGAFTKTLLQEAEKDKDIIAMATDSAGSVTLTKFRDTFPERFVEVGIAEQDMVGIGAGLATCGKKVFACGPASFLSARALEQVKIDAAYSNTNIKLIGVSGGISYGALGESHYSMQDIAVMCATANLTVLLPADARQTEELTKQLVRMDGPVYVRMGRGEVPVIYGEKEAFEIGKAKTLLEGHDITIIAAGEMVYYALCAGKQLQEENISARVIDMFTLKPLDIEAIRKACRETKASSTAEEPNIRGGLGASVAQTVVEYRPVPMKIMAFPDEPLVPGNSDEMREHYGLNTQGMVREAKRLLGC